MDRAAPDKAVSHPTWAGGFGARGGEGEKIPSPCPLPEGEGLRTGLLLEREKGLGRAEITKGDSRRNLRYSTAIS